MLIRYLEIEMNIYVTQALSLSVHCTRICMYISLGARSIKFQHTAYITNVLI